MASSSHNPAILLKRALSLTEPSSFILCTDTISQTSHLLVNEVLHNISSGSSEPNILYVSFETINQPSFASSFIDVSKIGLAKVAERIQSLLPDPKKPSKNKNLIIIDSLNYISKAHLAQFISSVAAPHCTVLATFHKDMPETHQNGMENYPSADVLLEFMATSILEIEPILPVSISEEELRTGINTMSIPRGVNNPRFEVTFTNRRKSGRSLAYTMNIDTVSHSYELATKLVEENNIESTDMLQDLTTFNLSTSAKQREAKDQVALPFLEAQNFSTGGAIVYEYEKDDDYDEEDPYEDPY